MTLLFILLVSAQFKHFIADYPLQTPWMLGKFKSGWDFVLPLIVHSGIHGAFTLAMALIVAPSMWWLCFVDMGIHFGMDRLKAGPKYLGRYKALSAKEFGNILSYSVDGKGVEWTCSSDAFNKFQKQFKDNTYFWWSLGLDQMVHHLTDLGIVFALISQ